MKTTLLALIVLFGVLAESSRGASITYWFSGFVDSINNSSNAMPFNVNVGAPFAGQLTYDPALVSYSNVNSYPEGDVGFYYFTNTAGYSVIFQIAGHTITNITHPGRNSGLIGVYDQYNNEDSYWAETGGSLTIDGNPFLADPYFSGIYLYLDDDSKTAFNTVAIPTNAPTLSDFASHRDLTWGAYIDDGGPTRLFSVHGILTSISTNELVLLNYRSPSATTLQLGWPATLSGFTLESVTDFALADWQTVTNDVAEIGAEHTVTISTGEAERFFRLKK